MVRQVVSSDVIIGEEQLDSRSIGKLLSFAVIGVKGRVKVATGEWIEPKWGTIGAKRLPRHLSG